MGSVKAILWEISRRVSWAEQILGPFLRENEVKTHLSAAGKVRTVKT